MESKALSSPARNPRRNGQFSSKMAALWPRGRLHESRYRNESAKPELPLFQQSDSRFRPFHLPESKTSAVGRHQGSFRISYTKTTVVVLGILFILFLEEISFGDLNVFLSGTDSFLTSCLHYHTMDFLHIYPG